MGRYETSGSLRVTTDTEYERRIHVKRAMLCGGAVTAVFTIRTDKITYLEDGRIADTEYILQRIHPRQTRACWSLRYVRTHFSIK